MQSGFLHNLAQDVRLLVQTAIQPLNDDEEARLRAETAQDLVSAATEDVITPIIIASLSQKPLMVISTTSEQVGSVTSQLAAVTTSLIDADIHHVHAKGSLSIDKFLAKFLAAPPYTHEANDDTHHHHQHHPHHHHHHYHHSGERSGRGDHSFDMRNRHFRNNTQATSYYNNNESSSFNESSKKLNVSSRHSHIPVYRHSTTGTERMGRSKSISPPRYHSSAIRVTNASSPTKSHFLENKTINHENNNLTRSILSSSDKKSGLNVDNIVGNANHPSISVDVIGTDESSDDIKAIKPKTKIDSLEKPSYLSPGMRKDGSNVSSRKSSKSMTSGVSGDASSAISAEGYVSSESSSGIDNEDDGNDIFNLKPLSSSVKGIQNKENNEIGNNIDQKDRDLKELNDDEILIPALQRLSSTMSTLHKTVKNKIENFARNRNTVNSEVNQNAPISNLTSNSIKPSYQHTSSVSFKGHINEMKSEDDNNNIDRKLSIISQGIYDEGHVPNIIIISDISKLSTEVLKTIYDLATKKQITFRGSSYLCPNIFLIIGIVNETEISKLPWQIRDLTLLNYGWFHHIDIGGTLLSIEQSQPLTTLGDIEALNRFLGQVYVHKDIAKYIRDIITFTRNHQFAFKGLTPKVGQDLTLAAKSLALISGREYVSVDDVKTLAVSLIAHRLSLNQRSINATTSTRVTSAEVIRSIIRKVPIPQ